MDKPRIYVSASEDENLSDAQRSVKHAVFDDIGARGFDGWGYLKEGPLSTGWGFAEASNAMANAHGALVLAFAQWECQPLGPRTDSGLKASEGNHFEGGLAIAHGVPLLVLKEDGVQVRGIVEQSTNHAVVPMPRHVSADWVRTDERFRKAFNR